MNARRMLVGTVTAVAVAGALVAPSVLAAPYAGQYVGLRGVTSVTGTDGATYRVAVEVTRPGTANVGLPRELRVDVTRCVRTRCVEIGHHLKPLLAEEVEVADDYRSGRVTTAFGGTVLVAVWRDPTPGGTVELGGGGFTGLGLTTLPHPGVKPEVYAESGPLEMTLTLGAVRCVSGDAHGYQVTGADTVGRELRENRTPDPARLPPGLMRARGGSPRCVAPPPSAAQASPAPSPSASAAPAAPARRLPVRREIVEIRRTRKTGIAVLALAGRIAAQDTAGFFGAIDVHRDGKSIYADSRPELVDFGLGDDAVRYGHGSTTPLCTLPLVCVLDKDGGEMSFTLTVADDTRDSRDWAGRTHYLLLEGTGVELESAAVGFSVKRRRGGFDRRTAIDADADGLAALGLHAELFRAASLTGGSRGSVAVGQLPCEGGSGVGAATLTHDTDGPLGALAPLTCGNQQTGVNRDSHIRAAVRTAPGAWRLEGAASGVTTTRTRLLVMHL